MPNENKNNKMVLVIETIDDEAPIQKVLHDKLTLEGFKVLGAKDGEEGLSMALNEHPDIILLDLLMPKMDGLTMMKKLRQTGEWGKKVPIILLTNLSPDDEKINKAITKDEPAYYLVKSNFTMESLVEKIKERLSRMY
jgi:two-component system response regulator VicR